MAAGGPEVLQIQKSLLLFVRSAANPLPMSDYSSRSVRFLQGQQARLHGC